MTPTNDILYSDIKKQLSVADEFNATVDVNLSSILDDSSVSLTSLSSKSAVDRTSDATLTTERTALSSSSIEIHSNRSSQVGNTM